MTQAGINGIVSGQAMLLNVRRIRRKLEITRADVENASMMPIDRLVADVRARSAGPIQGWEDLVPIMTGDGLPPEERGYRRDQARPCQAKDGPE
jgi:hypothetical protein